MKESDPKDIGIRKGTLTWPDGQKYVGEFRDDKRHGQGTQTWPDGQKYLGEWRDGKRHGQGTSTSPDGQKYVGEFRDDKYNGQGTYTWPDGKKYFGEWRDDKINGQGTYTWLDGKKYVGEFRDGKYNGQGTYTWLDGKKYFGEWRDDKRHGQGTYTSPDGQKYVGEFRDDKRHGQATHTWPNGEKHVGEWKDGKLHGQGTHTWPDGKKYVGEWKDGKQHGQGTYTSPDGAKYVGEWKDGKQHGQGTHTPQDGKKYVGEWKDGKHNGEGAEAKVSNYQRSEEWAFDEIPKKSDKKNDTSIRIINSEQELSALLNSDQMLPSGVINTSGYGSLSFQCGCESMHKINDPTIQKIACFRPVKLLLKCSTHYTKIRIKGIFSQKCISEWSCSIKLLVNLTKELGLHENQNIGQPQRAKVTDTDGLNEPERNIRFQNTGTKDPQELKKECLEFCGSIIAGEIIGLQLNKYKMKREFNDNEKEQIYLFMSYVLSFFMEKHFQDYEIDNFLFCSVFGPTGHFKSLGLTIDKGIRDKIRPRLTGDPEMILTFEEAKECVASILKGHYQTGALSKWLWKK